MTVCIELVSFVNTIWSKILSKSAKASCSAGCHGQPQMDRCSFAGRNRQLVVRRRLRAFMLRIDCLLIAVNDVFVDSVFNVVRTVCVVEETLSVRVVLREEQLGSAVAV